jgi:hypothetical protein
MNRREFFSVAAAGAVAGPTLAYSDRINSLTEQIEAAIRRELPDIKNIEVKYNPDDERLPLVVVAYRI